ncbi:5,6-dimethylbenzimidazole synthase [Oxobacter pfennigii]|uniref:5,6-dimethylbenzimidazole synthase n=1 Tax=Oxobacter pfennigii TaxID=36849 RepID=A0A0P8W9P4_9CLOT|nr:nitroreductase family protein [Oxobacter pfennigii]KPU45359.1 5,6-dimethylbenzimidazole synthase [Oxobacter pfennigii]
MELYDIIEKRRSIRKYKDIPVEKEKLYRIFKSATLIPSWSCKHCWRFIIVDELETKLMISQAVDESNPAQDALKHAPMIVIICANPVDTEEIDDKEYYMADCGIAMEHIMLSATYEGLATCWIGLFDEDNIKSILKIPSQIRIVGITPLGYGDEMPEDKEKVGIKDITYYNKWESNIGFNNI